jgi:saxitoxin biosynthesis operon SxtJ-like protein
MAERIPARLTAAEGRKFGLTVGLAFVAIGGILTWRGKSHKALFFYALGGVLIAAGLVVPTRLGPVERGWMALAHAISKVTTPIFMGVVYFVVMTPIGFIRRRMGSPIAAARVPGASRWETHSPGEATAEQMEHQF